MAMGTMGNHAVQLSTASERPAGLLTSNGNGNDEEPGAAALDGDEDGRRLVAHTAAQLNAAAPTTAYSVKDTVSCGSMRATIACTPCPTSSPQAAPNCMHPTS